MAILQHAHQKVFSHLGKLGEVRVTKASSLGKAEGKENKFKGVKQKGGETYFESLTILLIVAPSACI